MKVINFLRGKKTYILAVCAGAITVVRLLGLIDVETWTTLMGLFGAGSLATLRSAVK